MRPAAYPSIRHPGSLECNARDVTPDHLPAVDAGSQEAVDEGGATTNVQAAHLGGTCTGRDGGSHMTT